ncbi:MAG: aldehyde dehydrogenase family protein, partial [Armatimonadetes bacterium]|nr:aldehyde dehydrogenase family protein [Armatimonadota bacterium]MDW8154940.1 aldehyde dehydrogenase family protein [Armatimonadota bacterium]
MFIGGKESAFPGLERFPVINPATGEVVDTVPLATEREVDEAVCAAHEAFPGWWDTPAASRGEILYAAVERVKA